MPRLYHIPLTLSQQGLLGVLLGEGEHDRLRRLVTLSQMHPRSLAPQVVKLTSRSILPTNLWARSWGQTESRAVRSDRGGYSSSCGRTRQCKVERQLPGLKLPPPTAPPLPLLPSQLRSSEGVDRNVVQNIIIKADWAWAIWRKQAPMETPRKIWQITVLSQHLHLFPVFLCKRSLLRRDPKAKMISKVSKTQPKHQHRRSQLVTDRVQQSVFIEWISSDIWWSLHAYCLSCEGRRPAMPSEGKRASQDLVSQQPNFTLPLAFLPLQQQFSSMRIVYQISISLLCPCVWALHI